MGSLPFGDLFGGFGSAGLPWLKSTSQNVPMQDWLFNAFQNRQSIFSPSPTSGTPGAAAATPFYQQLSGGGLAWSYDPNWMTSAPKPPVLPQTFSYEPTPLAEVLAPRKPRPAGSDPYPPLTDPDEWERTKGDRIPFLPRKPAPPPGRTGDWQWSNGAWVWVDSTPFELPPTVPGYKRDLLQPY